MLDRKLLWAALLLVPLVGACAQPVGEGHVEIDPEALDFGAVETGSSTTRTFEVRNAGPRAVSLRELKVAGDQADQFVLESPSAFAQIELPAGQTLAVAVGFRPSKGEPASGELSFMAGSAQRSVALRGTGVNPPPGPRIVIQFEGPTTLTPMDASTQVRVSNAGDEPLRFAKPDGSAGWQEAAPELVGDDESEFALIWPSGHSPAAEVAAGEVVSLHLQFRPKSAGPKAVTLRFYSNDAKRAVVDVAVGANTAAVGPCSIEVVPERLDFDATGMPGTGVVHLEASRSSEAELCIVRGLQLEEGSSQAFELKGASGWAAIPRGEALEVSVHFTPDGQEHSGRVLFEIEGIEGAREIPLSARILPGLAVAPEELDFGVVGDCRRLETSLIAYTPAPVPRVIESIDVVGSGAFSISQKPTLPRTLAPGEQVEIRVTFRPVATGPASGLLEVKSGGGGSPIQVALSGPRSPVLVQVDTFAPAPHPPKQDVLVVIDDSPSMADKQQAIQRNLESHFRFWDEECVDYQVAFTTTAVDVAHGGDGAGPDYANGRFLPLDGSRPRVVSRAMPDHLKLLLQNARVGTAGTGPAYLMKPVRLALSSPLIDEENSGFLRPDAHLQVLVISDRADHDSAPIGDYVAFLRSLQNPNRRVEFSAVVPTQAQPAAGCTYGEPDAGASTRVEDLAAGLRGAVLEICGESWFSQGSIGGWCARSRYYLSNRPTSSDSIRVEIDQEPVDPADAHGKVRWKYNATVNSIDFEPDALPGPGSPVTAVYEVECMPR